MKFNFNIVMVCFLFSGISFADVTGPVQKGLGQYEIDSGTVITEENSISAVTGITAGNGDHYSVSDDGVVSVILNNAAPGTGVNVSGGGEVNLGQGSDIHVTDTSFQSVTGIRASGGGQFTAGDISVSVEGGTAYGINVQSASVTLTGTDNVISVNSSNGSATGITAAGQSNNKALFSAENMTLSSDGTGISAQNNSEVTLTGDTAIRTNKGGIEVNGSGVVSAERVDITTTGSSAATGGIFSLQGGTVQAGAGSSITTENMHGLYATTVVGYPAEAKPTRIDYTGSENNRNRIHVNGLTAVTAYGDEVEINLSETDITTHSLNNNTVGIRVLQGATVNAHNTSVTVSDNDTDFNSIAAVLVRNNDAQAVFSGNTVIDARDTKNGTAVLADGNASSVTVTDTAFIYGDVIAEGNDVLIELDLNNGSYFSGTASVTDSIGDTVFTGSEIRMTLYDSIWNMSGDSDITALIAGSGAMVNLGGDGSSGNTLTVRGDYTGNGGYLVFNGALAGDDSVTDKLIIQGSTQGETFVSVRNLGGQGAQTVEGIELITVAGESDGNFLQQERIVAGAYDYFLVRGRGGNSQNWYLTSADISDPEVPPAGPENQVVRPEAGSYISNLYEANRLFSLRLHDRTGSARYTSAMNSGQEDTGMWMRNMMGHTNSWGGNNQLKTGSNRYALQLGGDIAQWSGNGTDRYYLGLMAGYGRVQSNTTNTLTGYRATAHTDGYSVGAYGTYYSGQDDTTGLYVDTWVQYNRFKNRIDGDYQKEEKYDSGGLMASVESGYSFPAGSSKGNKNHGYIRPELQLIYGGVRMDSHTESNGTRVSGHGENNLQSRIGVRVAGPLLMQESDAKGNGFRPFAEVNWIHNTQNTGVSMDGSIISQSGARNIGEIKAGLEGHLTDNVAVWFNVARQAGTDSYSDTQGMLGIRVRF